MDTSPKNQRALLWNAPPPAPRQPTPGEPLWAIRKHGHQLACELRDHGEWGVEVQVYRDLEFLYGRCWPTRALALEEADQQKVRYLAEGGVLIA